MSPGRIASLHLHPSEGGEPLVAVTRLEVVAGKGIVGNRRYFDRKRRDGTPSLRQITLIEREQLAEHAAALGMGEIAPGVARSNIETVGISLVPLVGRRIRIASAVLEIHAPRDPCEKMDRICEGLRELMKPHRQGVLATIVSDGAISVGDAIEVL
jgi:MOSC domain-containing protein YiiM